MPNNLGAAPFQDPVGFFLDVAETFPSLRRKLSFVKSTRLCIKSWVLFGPRTIYDNSDWPNLQT